MTPAVMPSIVSLSIVVPTTVIGFIVMPFVTPPEMVSPVSVLIVFSTQMTISLTMYSDGVVFAAIFPGGVCFVAAFFGKSALSVRFSFKVPSVIGI
jgi:hypothetical protein